MDQGGRVVTPLSTKPYFPPEATSKEFAKQLASTTYALWSACCVGNPAANVRKAYEEMKDPQPGDLVLEISSINFEEWPGAGLGHLRFVCKAKPRTEDEWDAAIASGYFKMDSPRGNGPYWLIDPIDGSQRTYWSNARFIRVPPPRERVTGPVVFTRDSIVAVLADSGFELREGRL
jgi:hypothetical protein